MVLLEQDLYAPVRDYLESLGYEVKGEVKPAGAPVLFL